MERGLARRGSGDAGGLGSRFRGSAASDPAVIVGSMLTSGQWYNRARTKRRKTYAKGRARDRRPATLSSKGFREPRALLREWCALG